MVLINVYFIVFLFYMYCKSFIIYFLFIIQLIIQFKNVSTDLVLIILTTQIEYVSALSIVFFLNTCKFNSFFFFSRMDFFFAVHSGISLSAKATLPLFHRHGSSAGCRSLSVLEPFRTFPLQKRAFRAGKIGSTPATERNPNGGYVMILATRCLRRQAAHEILEQSNFWIIEFSLSF